MIEIERIKESADYIISRLAPVFDTNKAVIGIVCGSGLANISEIIENVTEISYKDIPHFPISTAPGHKSLLICGTIGAHNVIAMQGRFHYYEGYTMQEVTYGIRVMKALGTKEVIITNSSGGMNPTFSVGDLMIITDHINLMPNPLIGKNDDSLGERFPSMHEAYSKRLVALAQEVAQSNNIWVKRGVYLGNTGPSFETPAEYKFYYQIGASCVGMSTVPEVIVAVHSGMEVLAISLISNVFNEKKPQHTTGQEVLLAGKKAEKKMETIVKGVVERL